MRRGCLINSLRDTLLSIQAKLTQDLASYEITVARMFDMARRYAADLLPFAHLSFEEFYNHVRRLKYHADPPGVEMLSRPRYTVRPDWPFARDCDDKAILLLAFAFLKGLRSRLACVGTRPGAGPHHVYPEIELGGAWVPTDATYDDRCVFGGRLYDEEFRRVFYGTADT